MNKEYSFKIFINDNCINGKVFYNKDYEIDFRRNDKTNDNIFRLHIGNGYMRYYFSMKTGKAIWFGGHKDCWCSSWSW